MENTVSITMNDQEPIQYRDSTYEIVSKVAYLIGVPLRIFENEYEPPKMDIFAALNKDKSARIIRNLCIVRNSIERNFKNINDRMRTEYRTIASMPEYVPADCLNELHSDGINFIKKSSIRLAQHVVEINRIISDRINNCKSLFPLWINWLYIRDLFNMPDGLTEEGTKAAAETFYSNMADYPYQVYINWKPQESGNILYNDKKFVTLLYRQHNDEFVEFSKVSDASGFVKGTVYDYIDSSQKVELVVDCENSDPYKLSATLRNLDESYTSKIAKIILFDDVHTATAWRVLEEYTHIPVEHIMVERIKAHKSQVDMRLALRTQQEFYENNVDSFILVSSDSDYWALIDSVKKARFLVMVERESCSPDMKKVLVDRGIFYCYIDDFYSGNAEGLKFGALFKEFYRYIDSHMSLNLKEMMNEALIATRLDMTPAEQKQFYDKYLKTISMEIEADGTISVKFRPK